MKYRGEKTNKTRGRRIVPGVCQGEPGRKRRGCEGKSWHIRMKSR